MTRIKRWLCRAVMCLCAIPFGLYFAAALYEERLEQENDL
jgi:hypothetical protein